ncbi:PREDICTED: putative neuropeptide Y receptor type 6 [Acropora digitifera]|uniref:putative neuropeptide Y receptor type 6 n=1 Tax=Acropora digitifera TaxID=70779 RepID=UPI00077AB2AC|nr:PREDICTED: putative neuropeptide Y receptor type 6 [Acropora digitifera]
MDQETPSTAQILNASINETVAIASNRKRMYISEPLGMAITRLILFGMLFLAAVIGNYFVFTVFVRSRRLHTFSYCLIMNLAVSDFLSILGVPFLLINQQLQSTWIYGSVLCRLINPSQVACGLVTSNVHVAIAIDRYSSIVRPLRYTPCCTGCHSYKRLLVVSVIWLLALLCSAPAYLFRELYTVVTPSGVKLEFCIETFPSMGNLKYGWRHVYSIFLFVTNYFLPISISTVLYVNIVHSLKKTERNRKTLGRKISQTFQGEAKVDNVTTYLERRFISMMIMIIVVFFFCYLPYQVVFLLSEFNYGVEWPYFRILLNVVYFLTWLPNAVNPICFGAMDRKYAKAFRKICSLF